MVLKKRNNFAERYYYSRSADSVTFRCKKDNTVNLNELNLAASGKIKELCRCRYYSDDVYHYFEYDISFYSHPDTEKLDEKATVALLKSIVLLADIVNAESVCSKNFAVNSQNVFWGADGVKFIYLPVGENAVNDIYGLVTAVLKNYKKGNKCVKLLLKNLNNNRENTYNLLCESIKRAEADLSNNPKASGVQKTVFINRDASDNLGMSGSVTGNVSGSESETTLFGHNEASGSESETTLFGHNEASISEEETTILSAQDSQGETTVLQKEDNGTLSFRAVLFSPKNETKYNIPYSGCIIGSDFSECNIVINNRTVSRKHAEFIAEGKKLFIKDIGSTNGTIIDGLTVKPYEKNELANGSFITLGDEPFQVILE